MDIVGDSLVQLDDAAVRRTILPLFGLRNPPSMNGSSDSDGGEIDSVRTCSPWSLGTSLSSLVSTFSL